jgi:hypothetical protein
VPDRNPSRPEGAEGIEFPAGWRAWRRPAGCSCARPGPAGDARRPAANKKPPPGPTQAQDRRHPPVSPKSPAGSAAGSRQAHRPAAKGYLQTGRQEGRREP